ncbi:MAG: hypothetical protein FVQ80_07535 [Planctomycetes bacterium]|nr:hypothetical protein [Planctomycetota bacterium]
MNKGDSNIFEKYVEKLVLVLAGLICIWILFTRVLFSPNNIEFDGRVFSPGEIDNYVIKKAEAVEDGLGEKPKAKSPYDPCFPVFEKLIDSAISNVDFSIPWPIPTMAPDESRIERKYRLPNIADIEIEDVESGNISAVAYVPIVELDEEVFYGDNTSEPNDIDIVTVEGHFDVSALYELFYESFAGEDIEPDWRDPCLATPVFAAVDLQRKEISSDGSESSWEVIPRTKVDIHKEMFRIIENVKSLPAGGIRLRMLQYEDPEMAKGLLQPESYKIASTNEEWFPPSLYQTYKKYSKDIESEERRRLLEIKKQERENRLAERKSSKAEGRSSRGGGGLGGMPGMGGGGGARRAGTKSRSSSRSSTRSRSSSRSSAGRDRSKRDKEERLKRKASEKKTIGDVYDELDAFLIDADTDFSEMEESLVFWAHDDTVEEGKRYRYRIRLGVFNPIAGTNQFVKEDEDKKYSTILWTDFSETEAVEIPQRLIMFAREIQEKSNTVTIQVSRYVLGYWYSKDFMVQPGEVIGRAVEYEPEDEFEESFVTTPEVINYSTNTLLVDVEALSDWYWAGGSLRERYYFDMLYSADGDEIKHMPIKTRYWSEDFQTKFTEIKRLEKMIKQPLRAWGDRGSGGGGGGRRGRIGSPGMGGIPGMGGGRPTRGGGRPRR